MWINRCEWVRLNQRITALEDVRAKDAYFTLSLLYALAKLVGYEAKYVGSNKIDWEWVKRDKSK